MTSAIVVLSASSGGGHNAAAKAIVNRIRAQYGDQYEYKIIDIYRNNLVSRLPGLAKIRYQSDFVWRLFFRITNRRWAVEVISLLMRRYMLHLISRELPKNTSHLIAVHFNPAQILKSLAMKFNSPPQTSIVVTDFDPHWAWLGKETDQLFVVSDSGVNRARSIGYTDKTLTKMQIVPVEELQHKSVMRKANAPWKLLLIAGQDGSNGRQIHRLVEIIGRIGSNTDIELTVICGKNEKLKHSMEQMKQGIQTIDLKINGYVDNVAQTFHNYDLMLVRTSPGVLSECISAGVPVLGFDWTAHEVFQTTYIEQNGLGIASRDSNQQTEFLCKVIGDTEYLDRLQRNVAKVRKKIDYCNFVQRLVNGAR